MSEKQGFVRWFLTGYVKIVAVAMAFGFIVYVVGYITDPPDKEAAIEWSSANAELLSAEEARLSALRADIMELLEQGNLDQARIKLTALVWDVSLNNPYTGPGSDVHEKKWRDIRADLESVLRRLSSSSGVGANPENGQGAGRTVDPQPKQQDLATLTCDEAKAQLLGASDAGELESAKTLVSNA